MKTARIAAGLAFCAAAGRGLSDEPAQKPNIILILADDLGYMDLSCYGSPVYLTPNIDRLASESLRFTQAYTAAHICSPTRASIMTGKFPARLHVTDWIPGYKQQNTKFLVPEWTLELISSEVTIGEYLKQEGYKTAWLGKWHLGGKGGCRGQGFDAGNQNWDLNSKKDNDDPKGVFTLNREAFQFMEASKGTPFFLGISHYAVHTPIRCNEELKKKYAQQKLPQGFRPEYCAMVETFDDSIGQLLRWIDENGLRENTVVVFFSDNGGLSEWTNNSPLKGGKGTLYEGGTRVPLMVRWPGKADAGQVTDEMVCSIDLLPTFMEMAGAEPPENIDGVSLVPLITKGIPMSRDMLCWHYPHYHSDGPPSGSILKGKYKLVEFFDDGRLEMYNLAEDPFETRNIAAEMPEKTEKLFAALKAWRKEVGAQMMEPNPNYDPARSSGKGAAEKSAE